MNLTWTIEYAVQTGRARIVSFKWLLPSTGLGATESGIDGRIFGVVPIIPTLVFAALGLDVASCFRSALFASGDVVMSQATIFARAKSGH